MPKSKKQKTRHQHGTTANGEDLSYEEIWDDSALLRSWNDAVKEYEFYHSIHARGEDIEEVLRQAELAESQSHTGSSAAVPSKSQANHTRVAGGDSSDEGEINESPKIAETTKLSQTRPGVSSIDMEESKALTEATRSNGTSKSIVQSSTGVNLHASENMERDSMLIGSQAVMRRHEQSQSRDKANSGQTGVNSRTSNATAPQHDEGEAEIASHENPPQDQTLENIKMAYYWAGYYSGLYDGQRQRQTQKDEGVTEKG